MSEISDKAKDIESRMSNMLDELEELSSFEPEKGPEGTIKARINESANLVRAARKKLGKAIHIAS